MGEFYHNWITGAVTDLVFRRLADTRERPRYRWDAMLNPETSQTSAVASATEQQGRTIVPRPFSIFRKGEISSRRGHCRIAFLKR